MKTGRIKKIFASLLAITLVFTLVTINSHINAEDTSSGLEVNKTAKWNSDGTATITLESYATGTVQTGKNKPTDYVLVIDQSGSIAENGHLNTIKNSVRSFADLVSQDAKDHNLDHRIAMTGFAADKDGGLTNDKDYSKYPVSGGQNFNHYRNTGLYIEGTLKNYITYGYKEIYKSDMDKDKDYYIELSGEMKKIEYEDDDDFNSWYYKTKVNKKDKKIKVEIKQNVNDNTEGRYQAYTIATEPLTSDDYQKSLVNINSNGSLNNSVSTAINNLGSNGGTYAEYGMEMANNVFKNNSINPEERNRVIVFFTDGASEDKNRVLELGNDSKTTYGASVYVIGLNNSATDSFLNGLSSNYENATALGKEDEKKWINVSKDYYYPTSDANSLKEIFEKIYRQTQSSLTKLDEKSIVSDVISSSFKVPSKSDVKIYTQEYKGNNEWENRVSYTGSGKANVSISDNTVNVSNFDYSSNYVLEKDVNGNPTGKKLVIEITVRPIDGFIGGNNVFTNDKAVVLDKSGGKEMNEFPKPDIDIPLQYDPLTKDATIYIGDNWKDVEKFINDGEINYKNKRNNSNSSTQYAIDGNRNKYVNITYDIYDGDNKLGTYTINAGQTKGSFVPNAAGMNNLNTATFTDCHEFKVVANITPITDGDAKALTDVQKPATLHVLKPSVTLEDSTVFFGDSTDLTKNVHLNWICKDNHNNIPEPATTPNVTLEYNQHQSNGKLEGTTFTPTVAEPTDFDMTVKNNGNDITSHTKFYNSTKKKNENLFTINVRSGSIQIKKKLKDTQYVDSSDGNPIFIFKVTANSGIYEGQTFYRYVRFSEDDLNKTKSTVVIDGLPKGTYKVEEMQSLRYEFYSVTLNSYSWWPGDNTYYNQSRVNNVEVSESKVNRTVTFTNKVKSDDYFSDNDILVNKFVKEGNEVVIKQDRLDK